VDVYIAKDDTGMVKSKCGSMLPYGVDEVLEFICKPPIKAKQLIITSRAKNTSLVLCEVEVYAIGKSIKYYDYLKDYSSVKKNVPTIRVRFLKRNLAYLCNI
jgi:hypothetical protein